MARFSFPVVLLCLVSLVSGVSAYLDYVETGLIDQTHEQHSPAAEYAWAHDEFLVVYIWDRSAGGQGVQLWAQRVDSDGATVGDPFLISDTVGPMANPDVAFSVTNDHYLVVWTDDRDTATNNDDIYGRLIAGGAGGGPGGSEFVDDEIHIAVREDAQRYPAVAYDSVHHNFLVVWEDMRNSDSIFRRDIFGQRVRASDGALQGGNFQITSESAHGSWPNVGYCPAGSGDGDDNFLVIWSNQNGIHSLTTGQRVNTDGSLLGDPFGISAQEGLLPWGRSALAYAPPSGVDESRFLVAHCGRDEFSRMRAWGQLVAGKSGHGTGGGELIDSPRVLGDATGSSFFDVIYVGDIARFLVVWNEAIETSGIDRRGCWLNYAGVPLIGDFAIADEQTTLGRNTICVAQSIIGDDRPRVFFTGDISGTGYGRLVTRELPQWAEIDGVQGRGVESDFLQIDVSLFGWNMIGVRPPADGDVDVAVFPEVRFFTGDPLCESEWNGPGRAEVIAINGLTEGDEQVLMQLDFKDADQHSFDFEQAVSLTTINGTGEINRVLGADNHFIDVINWQVVEGEQYVVNLIPRDIDRDFNLALFQPSTVTAGQYQGLETLRDQHPAWKQDGINPGHVETIYLNAEITGLMGIAVWIAEEQGEYRLVVRDPDYPTTEEIVRHLLGLSGIPWHEQIDGGYHTINGDDVWDAADVVANILAGR